MTRIRLGLLALAFALVSACQGSVTGPEFDNVVASGSGGMSADNVVASGSGG